MVESCALEADLVQLEGGDNTEIGEEEEEGQKCWPDQEWDQDYCPAQDLGEQIRKEKCYHRRERNQSEWRPKTKNKLSKVCSEQNTLT